MSFNLPVNVLIIALIMGSAFCTLCKSSFSIISNLHSAASAETECSLLKKTTYFTK